MINDAPLARFQSLANGLVKPIYADYSFGNIANTIELLLTGNRRGPVLPPDCFGRDSYPEPQKIVTVFVDSFGWEFWQQYHSRFRATQLVVDRGTLTPISALFPSTTAASVSTLNLGVLPAEHALYEWNIYIPAYGETIQSLAFCPLGMRVQDACLKKGYDPARLLEVHETAHQRLQRKGVRSLQFAHRAYATSAYNGIVNQGAEVTMHATLAEGLVQLKEALIATPGKAWLGYYWAAIDTMAHYHGPGSPTHAAEIASFWRTFDEVFRDVDSPDTLYLFTADHGHIYGDRRETFYINERIPELADCLPVSPAGNPIYPNGCPRDMFLHVRPERRARGARPAGALPRGLRPRPAHRRGAEARALRAAAGEPRAAPPPRRHFDPASSRPLRVVARSRPHGKPFLGQPWRPEPRGADHRARRRRRTVMGL